MEASGLHSNGYSLARHILAGYGFGIGVRFLGHPVLRDFVRVTIGTDDEMKAFLAADDALPQPEAGE